MRKPPLTTMRVFNDFPNPLPVIEAVMERGARTHQGEDWHLAGGFPCRPRPAASRSTRGRRGERDAPGTRCLPVTDGAGPRCSGWRRWDQARKAGKRSSVSHAAGIGSHGKRHLQSDHNKFLSVRAKAPDGQLCPNENGATSANLRDSKRG
jgi:hypothetical protein